MVVKENRGAFIPIPTYYPGAVAVISLLMDTVNCIGASAIPDSCKPDEQGVNATISHETSPQTKSADQCLGGACTRSRGNITSS